MFINVLSTFLTCILLAILVDSQTLTCDEEHGKFQCGNGECVPVSKKCDVTLDCTDGTDEEGCDDHTCSPGYFPCNDSKSCMPDSWRCDGEPDCSDEGDEMNCSTAASCNANDFACANGQCINSHYVCDEDNDCEDGSDEEDCPATAGCEVPDFECIRQHQCIPRHRVCDNETDCDDGTDEEGCKSEGAYDGKSSCPESDFECTSLSRCIPLSWRCDGDKDCHDGSDESNCSDHTCPVNQYQCKVSKSCIPASWRCDSDPDCPSADDESDCSPRPCGEDEFTCADKKCVKSTSVCNGHGDCEDGYDEVNCSAVVCENCTVPTEPLVDIVCRFTRRVLGYRHPTRVRDLLLIGDESGSIGWLNHEKIKKAFQAIVKNLEGGIGREASQVGMASFARSSRLVFDFDDFDDVRNVVAAIEGAFFRGGYRSNIGNALTNANTWVFQQTGGMRSFPGVEDNVDHEILIVTDGCRTADWYMMEEALKVIRKRGIELYVVGVASNDERCKEAVQSMTESPENLFEVGNWDDFDEFIEKIERRECRPSKATDRKQRSSRRMLRGRKVFHTGRQN